MSIKEQFEHSNVHPYRNLKNCFNPSCGDNKPNEVFTVYGSYWCCNKCGVRGPHHDK